MATSTNKFPQRAECSISFYCAFVGKKGFVNQQYVIAEGYVFAPSVAKRNYMFELESILKSLKIK